MQNYPVSINKIAAVDIGHWLQCRIDISGVWRVHTPANQPCRISPSSSPYLTRAGLLQVILRLTQLWQLRVSLLPLPRELRVEGRRALGISALSSSARCTE